MKSLLLKDFYMTLKYCRAFLLIIIVFLAVSVFGDNNMFFVMYPLIISSVITVTLISYDELSKWNIYCEALPYTRSQIVSEKYLAAVIVIAITWVVTILTQILFVRPRLLVSWQQIYMTGVMLLAVGVISPAVILPFIFKFGVSKGRIAYYFVIGLICIAGTFVSFQTENFNFQLSQQVAVHLLLVVCLLIFAVSWLASISIYKKRQL